MKKHVLRASRQTTAVSSTSLAMVDPFVLQHHVAKHAPVACKMKRAKTSRICMRFGPNLEAHLMRGQLASSGFALADTKILDVCIASFVIV